MSDDAVSYAKTLIATVARAFYSDAHIVLMDLLLRERFVLCEEIGPRLRLPDKETRKIIAFLEEEMLIKSENVSMQGTKDYFKYYYIDYQLCVHVIRYRLWKMQTRIEEEQKQQNTEVQYQCPSCQTVYSILHVQRLIAGDGKFICSNCCDNDNFRLLPSQPSYRLVELSHREKAPKTKALRTKIQQQLSGEVGLREGIRELLDELRDIPLPHNLPSDNLRKGYQTSAVKDADISAEIEESLFDTARGKKGGKYNIQNYEL
jgi:transcription initiation factor TFIIE subunit alpha